MRKPVAIPPNKVEDTSCELNGGVQIVSPPPDHFCIRNPRFSGVVRSRRVTAGSQFPGELSRPRGALVPVAGGSELAWQQSMAPLRLHGADATGRTVRHPVQNPGPRLPTPGCPLELTRFRGRPVG